MVRNRYLAELKKFGVRVYLMANGPMISRRAGHEAIARMDPKMREKFDSICTAARRTSFQDL